MLRSEAVAKGNTSHSGSISSVWRNSLSTVTAFSMPAGRRLPFLST